MGLSILVFVKQVPDTQNIAGEAMKEDGTVNRAALPAIFNPEDLNALEMALQVRERAGGTVTVCTMGPPNAADALRQALYHGADRAVLLTDRAFAGADTLATSYALACAARKIGAYDLIFCGRQAIDGDTAQVGPQIAEKLGLPQLTYVLEIGDIQKDTITARCEIEGGYEVIRCPLPALLTVVATANDPRPPNARRLMQFRKARTRSELRREHGGSDYEDANKLAEEEAVLRARDCWIEEWNAADAGAEPERIGLSGSPTKVKKIESVKLTGGDHVEIPVTDDAIRDLMKTLVDEHILS